MFSINLKFICLCCCFILFLNNNIFTEANPINNHNHHNHHHHRDRRNMIIYAKIGDFINITCSNLHNSINNNNIPKYFKNKKRSINEEEDNEEIEQEQQQQYEISFSNNNNNNNNNAVDDNYEIDWWFIDKNGRNNIISYGNNIKSKNYKYKIFVDKPAHHNDNFNSVQIFDSPPTPSTSQLRSIKFSSSNNNHKGRSSINGENNGSDMPVFYLNALIESENDEGVYQCIDPNVPDFIIQNITVLISNNNYSSIFRTNLFKYLLKFLFSWYLLSLLKLTVI